ncbi:MAG TPA: CHAT domain-containing protein [Pyrinomonadaceae bacterium]
MKATLTLFFCLILSWHLSGGVSFPATNEDSQKRAQELLDLSAAQNRHLEHETAIQTARKALALFESIGDQKNVAETYVHLGRYHYALNRMSEAAQYYELALQIRRQQNDVVNEAEMLIQLSFVEGRQGEWLNGFSYLTQAQNLIDNLDKPDTMARIATGMAYVFNDSGLPEYGLTQYQRAKEYYRRAEDERAYNRQTMRIGYTQLLLKNYPAALTELEEALRYFETSGDSDVDASECREYMAQVYMAMGKYDLALQHLLPALSLYETTKKESDAAQVKALVGEIYQRQGKLELARTNYLAALKTFHEAPDPVKEAAVGFALGRLELSRGNYDAADNYLKASIETTEDIRSDLNSRVLATAFSASVHDRYETYIDCLMRKHKQQPSQGLELRAFQASELARARSLAALLRDTQTEIVTGIDPQLAEQERTLRQAIRSKAEETITLLAGDYNKDRLNELETSLTRLRQQHKQVVQKLQKQNPRYDQIKETTNYSVKQIQELIIEDDQTMLLEYFLGRNASYLWAITLNDAKVFVLPKADDITRVVQDVYKLLSTEPNDDTDQRLNNATAELSKLVLGPVADQLHARRIIVVADGALNYIPFQLLPLASRNNAPLVANYEVVNAPSASVLGQLREEKRQRPRRTKILAAFGDPVFASNYQQFKNSGSGEVLAASQAAGGQSWQRSSRDIEVKGDDIDPDTIQPLHYSKSELKKLSDLAGSQALIVRGFDASRGVLETIDFSKYAILHFATHGLLNPKNPENSGFLLSMLDFDGKPQNGFITMQDVYSLRVPVDLVVLSACRTGLGKDVRGEGLIGLTRGFMHAGASSVVASLWKVDDEATAELMKNFYANMLQKGLAPAEALREAQNTVRQNPMWQSPHFWAGFTLQGEFKEPIKLPAPSGAPLRVQNAVGGGFLLALLGGIAWGFKRRYSTTKL